MNLRKILKRVPLVMPAYQMLKGPAYARKKHALLSELCGLSDRRGKEIGLTLRSFSSDAPPQYREWIEKIEQERRILESRRDFLATAEGAVVRSYDRGVTIGQACLASKSANQALMLYLLVRNTNPIKVIELGTNIGIS